MGMWSSSWLLLGPLLSIRPITINVAAAGKKSVYPTRTGNAGETHLSSFSTRLPLSSHRIQHPIGFLPDSAYRPLFWFRWLECRTEPTFRQRTEREERGLGS